MRSVDFFGETIRLAEEPSQTAMMDFAEVASGELSPLEAMAATKTVIKACVHPDDWQRFWSLARKHNADTERDLMPVVVAVFEMETDRPTQRPSDSSDGPRPTAPSSTAGSSLLEERLRARPDLMVIVEDAQAAQRTA